MTWIPGNARLLKGEQPCVCKTHTGSARDDILFRVNPESDPGMNSDWEAKVVFARYYYNVYQLPISHPIIINTRDVGYRYMILWYCMSYDNVLAFVLQNCTFNINLLFIDVIDLLYWQHYMRTELSWTMTSLFSPERLYKCINVTW